ncbi:hypothetical protein EGW08_015114 [Elysia chlorotica]|uniref:Uncharacterized protein n=1 Tax=Elysia chlorotica TaxID=188477 RepID=A0A433T6F5_ELYCH|nr:hypothetical protein EGW08_015114 [Elysia chlorotica]
MPEVEELDDACVEKAFNIVDNGYGHQHESTIPNSTLATINSTVSALGATGIINTTVFNDTARALIANDTFEAILRNLTASVLSIDGDYKSLRYANSANNYTVFNHTTSSILKTIIPFNSSTSSSYLSSSLSFTTAATITSPTTTPGGAIMTPHDLRDFPLNDSSPVSSVTSSLETLLQNLTGVTADIGSAALDPNSTPFSYTDGGFSAPLENAGDTTFNKDFSGERGTKIVQSTAASHPNTKQTDLVAGTSVKASSPSTGSPVSNYYVNLSTTFYDLVNASQSGTSSVVHDPALTNLLSTPPSSNNTTMAAGGVDCSRTLLLLRTALHRTEVRVVVVELV